MDHHYDAIVIGAGPAGSSAATTLARAGHDVLLLDKATFPRDKTCGDGLTPRAVDVLGDLGALPELLAAGCRVRGTDVYAPGGRSVETPIPQTPGRPDYSLVVPRLVLDDILRRRSLQAGAAFEGGIHIGAVEQASRGIRVVGEAGGRRGSFTGTLGIVATGASTRLLRRMGILRYQPTTMVAARSYYEGLKGPHDLLQLRFDGVPLPGYGWIFPTGPGRANVGAGFLPAGWKKRWQPATPAAAFEAFLATPALRQSLAGARRTGPVKGYPLRVDFASAPTFGERILLAGEAAGLVNPLTGEGIDYALESGRLAGQHAAAMLAAGDFSPSRFEAYDQALRRQYQALFLFCNWVRDWCLHRPALDLLVALARRRGDLRAALTNIVLGNQAVTGQMSLGRVLRVLSSRSA